jgi:hypothetical protein
LDAKLFAIICNGEWYWPHARSDRIVDLQSKLPEVEVGTQDQPVWNCKKGEYVCSETWEAIRMKGFPVKWWKLVWNSVAIPRHSFLLWLVFRNALITKERMCGWGFQGDCLCLFCRGSMENREHLFFLCGFSKRIWKEVMALCFVRQQRNSWEDVENWSTKELRSDCLKSKLCRLRLGAAVYHLWKHRNDILHGNSVSSEEQIVAKIKWDVRARIMSKGPYKKSVENMQLASLWNLQKIVH